jgi:hypothetical protein
MRRPRPSAMASPFGPNAKKRTAPSQAHGNAARRFGSETYRVNGGLPAAREIQVARVLPKPA